MEPRFGTGLFEDRGAGAEFGFADAAGQIERDGLQGQLGRLLLIKFLLELLKFLRQLGQSKVDKASLERRLWLESDDSFRLRRRNNVTADCLESKDGIASGC
jgi:hypothetical protein